MDQDLITLPLLERSVFDQLVADTSQEAVMAILAATLPDLKRLHEQLEEFSCSKADIIALRSQAHLCKSAAGYIGTLRLQALCQALEDACHQNDISRLTNLITLSPSLIGECQASLEAELSLNKTN